jgi:hypothetical protein
VRLWPFGAALLLWYGTLSPWMPALRTGLALGVVGTVAAATATGYLCVARSTR